MHITQQKRTKVCIDRVVPIRLETQLTGACPLALTRKRQSVVCMNKNNGDGEGSCGLEYRGVLKKMFAEGPGRPEAWTVSGKVSKVGDAGEMISLIQSPSNRKSETSYRAESKNARGR